MPLLATLDSRTTIQKHHLIELIGDVEINIAMEKFNSLRIAGVISGEFSDDIWYMNNETEATGINFKFNEIAIYKQKNTSYYSFVLAVKVYICLCFGDYTLLIYPRIVNAIKDAVEATDCFTRKPRNTKSLQLLGVENFLSLFPWVDESFLFSFAESSYELQARRSLAEYSSYYIFNDLMIDFWETASDEEKDLYYPLYLWWNISMIIPIRVTEFSVTPKKCFEQHGDRWKLTIRRTCIKGRTDIEKRYKLETDYKKYTYDVPESIVSTIKDYQSRVLKVGESDIDSLFSDKLFAKAKKKLIPRAKPGAIYPHMRRDHFDMVLAYFYIYVIEEKYHYKIYEKDAFESGDIDGQIREMKPGEIVKLNLGDTRHIALQNLLLNGCNLLMAREISGHETIDSIFHYSGNMKNLIKSKAYALYKLSTQETNTITMMGTPDRAEMVLRGNKSGSYKMVDDGKCYSPRFVEADDASDCLAVAGNCFICIHHEDDSNLSEGCREQEKLFEEKAARVKIWMNSAKKLKDKERIMIAGEEMTTAARNLEILYVKKLHTGGQL